jgi:peptidyl-prolyl cis-trans isomerase-like 2
MGKKQHQQDKLYLTSTEWKHFFGGKKPDTSSHADSLEFRRLPFSCCALSFQPFEHPYCTQEGHVFDLENILQFLKKYGRNPITGQPLDGKSLIKMNFYKNSKEKYHCPITFKVFNENSHIVCIASSGNVFSFEAIEQLNIKANYFKDLLNDSSFTKKDIITIQDPSNLSKFNLSTFYYVKENLKWEKDDSANKQDPNYYLKSISVEAKNALDELKSSTAANSEATTSKKSNEVMRKADVVNAATYSTGRVAASFTSTVMEIVTKQEPAIIDEDEIRWSRLLKSGKKGYVCLVTNFGRLNIELFCDQVPQTCENFLKHCANKYYKDTNFHRVVKGFMVFYF